MVSLTSLKVSSHDFICQTLANIKYKYVNAKLITPDHVVWEHIAASTKAGRHSCPEGLN